jgi:hypothetical protein
MLFMCAFPPFQQLNQMTSFQEIRYEGSVTEGHSTVVACLLTLYS